MIATPNDGAALSALTILFYGIFRRSAPSRKLWLLLDCGKRTSALYDARSLIPDAGLSPKNAPCPIQTRVQVTIQHSTRIAQHASLVPVIPSIRLPIHPSRRSCGSPCALQVGVPAPWLDSF